MKHDEFKALVSEMRRAQKLYYSTPSGHPKKHDRLLHSKQLEAEVDEIISPQTKLF